MNIYPYEEKCREQWDCFVSQHPKGTFFHLTGWQRVVEQTFGYEPLYFYTERSGRITGVAPFFGISNWMIGRCLVSVPLAAYGGICGEDSESEQALVQYVRQLASEKKADYLELRNRNGGLLAGFHANSRYASFSTRLAADPETNWKRLPRDTRYMIRKGQKAGLQARHGLEQLEEFYRLFAVSMKRLGTPVYPISLFKNLVREFPGQVDLLLVYAGEQAVAGVFSFLFRDTILPYYAGALANARVVAANNFMYWSLMKFAAEAGLPGFDFGRSKRGTGSFAFKTQWNMNVEPLDYQVGLIRRKSVPNFSPANRKFEFAGRVWSRLPLKLTLWMGPRVVRLFP